MKKIEFDFISGNKSFWLYFISTSFPNAMDEESDIALSDFIYDEYGHIIDQDWINKFVQFSEEIMNKNDGYINEPNTLHFNLNAHHFQIAFHPGDTIYFLDGNEIGCTGSHFQLRTMQFYDFMKTLSGITDKKIPLLLLPMLALEESDISQVRKIVGNGIHSLEFKEEHIDKITDMILSGLLE